MSTIPRIDPQVRHITVGQLRRIELTPIVTSVVYINEAPAAVIVPFDTFMLMQEERDAKDRRISELERQVTGAQVREFART